MTKDLVKRLRETEYRDGFAIITIQEVREAANAIEDLEHTGKTLLAMRDTEIDRLRDLAFSALAAKSMQLYEAALIEIAGDPDE